MLLETDRLVLRKPRVEDTDIIDTILSCPTQTKYLPNEAPYSEQKKAVYLENRIEHWKAHGFGTVIVGLKSDPSIKIGFVGAEYAPNPNYVDIRFGIDRSYEGKGYITEAAKELVSWFFENTTHTKLFGVAMKDNLASKAVLGKLGMMEEKSADLYNCEGLDSFSINSTAYSKS